MLNGIDSNLYGPWLLYQAFIPLMKKNGYGRIVKGIKWGRLNALYYMQSGIPAYGISKVILNASTIKLVSDLNSTDKSSYYYCDPVSNLITPYFIRKTTIDDIHIEYNISIIIRIFNLVYKNLLYSNY